MSRRCRHKGCSQVLASLNPGPNCYLHEIARMPNTRKARRGMRPPEAGPRITSLDEMAHVVAEERPTHLFEMTRAEFGTYRDGTWVGPSAGEAS